MNSVHDLVIIIENHLDSVIIRGSAYPFVGMQNYLRTRNIIMSTDFRSRDLTSLFYDTSNPCSNYPAINISSALCTIPNPYNNTPIVAKPCLTFQDLAASGPKMTGKVSFLWTDINDLTRPEFNNIIIYNGQSNGLADSRRILDGGLSGPASYYVPSPFFCI